MIGDEGVGWNMNEDDGRLGRGMGDEQDGRWEIKESDGN